MNRFLFITYYYPPAGGPSIQRIIRIIRYMAQQNWNATVITVKEGDYTMLDYDLQEWIPEGTEVIRTEFFEPYKLYRRFTGKKQEAKIPLAVLSSHEKASFKERIANKVRANFFIPDGRIGWYRRGVKAGLKAIETDPDIKLVFTSGPPHTVHLIGRKIAEKTALPFVADFRDPWMNIDYYSDLKRSALTKKIDHCLEGKVLKSADAVTIVGPGYRDLLLEGHAEIPVEKTHIIYNGFDPEAYPVKESKPPQDKFVLTYIGNLPYNRYTPNFYRAIARLKRDKRIHPDSFQIHFYGGIDSAIKQEWKTLKIEAFVHDHGFVPHEEAIKAIVWSHVLILVINDTKTKKGIVPGKMFEYLPSKRVILGIGPPDGDAAHILRDTKSGQFFSYDDTEGIRRFLWDNYQQWKQHRWEPLFGINIERYKRSEQLSKLKEIFNLLAS